MVEENILVSPLGLTILVLLLTSFILIYRVVVGPTLPDRVVGFNTITTKMVVVIAVLSVLLREFYLLDLAIVLLMVNGVANLILSKHLEKEGAR
ncbi:MAG: monovalent cation/H+ antiporter complex subunit F [Thermoplasmatota archaeon]